MLRLTTAYSQTCRGETFGHHASGNSEMVGRIVRRSPLRAARITWGFVTKAYTRSAASARDLFFSDDIPAEDLERHAAFASLCT